MEKSPLQGQTRDRSTDGGTIDTPNVHSDQSGSSPQPPKKKLKLLCTNSREESTISYPELKKTPVASNNEDRRVETMQASTRQILSVFSELADENRSLRVSLRVSMKTLQDEKEQLEQKVKDLETLRPNQYERTSRLSESLQQKRLEAQKHLDEVQMLRRDSDVGKVARELAVFTEQTSWKQMAEKLAQLQDAVKRSDEQTASAAKPA